MRVLHHVLHQLRHIHVRFVAGGDHVAEIEAGATALLEQGVTHPAALGNDTHPPVAQPGGCVRRVRQGGAEGGRQIGHGVVIALRVGAGYSHARAGRQLGNGLLGTAAVTPLLGKPGADHHRVAHPGGGAVLQGSQHAGGGNGHQRHIHGFAQVPRGRADMGKTGQALDLPVAGVDGQDGAAVAVVHQKGQQTAADLGEVRGGTDHRHRLGPQQGVQGVVTGPGARVGKGMRHRGLLEQRHSRAARVIRGQN